MSLFKNIPTSKKAQAVGDKIIGLSHELKCIIISEQCVDFKKVDLGSLEYTLFMYDLECYRQVMTLKYSGFYIETILRTIFLTMESNMKKAGNQINDGFMFELFKNLSNSLHHVFGNAHKEGTDGLRAIAIHLCSNECVMSEQESKNNEDLIKAITKHFNKIINLPLNEI